VEQYTPELITIEEFAKRIGVCRATACDWKHRGVLRPGRHFIQHGRTIRFEWGPDLLKKLHEDCLQAEEQPTVEKKRQVRPKNKGKGSIDWDY